MQAKSPSDFLVNFFGYTRLNLTNLLINLLGLFRVNSDCFYVRTSTASNANFSILHGKLAHIAKK